MAQQIINNNDGGGVARSKINANNAELYAAIVPPIRTPGISVNVQVQIPANCAIAAIFLINRAGNPNVQLGITGGGTEIMDVTNITGFTPIKPDEYMPITGNVFVTISGGTVDMTIIVIPNLF